MRPSALIRKTLQVTIPAASASQPKKGTPPLALVKTPPQATEDLGTNEFTEAFRYMTRMGWRG